MSDPSFYEAVGGEPTFRKLVAAFYSGVATDPVLRPLYPEFDRFDSIRRELDPRGMFGNDFTKRIFGETNP